MLATLQNGVLMPLPASLLLQPDCPVRPAWALFDHVWYSQTYSDALPAGVVRTEADLLAYYLQSGCRAGHSPSPLFDELHYLADANIAALVDAGRYASGFDHYCQLGHRFHSGHWLFDVALYGGLYDDMALENLDANGIYGRYDHYLRSGQYEHRHAHALFDSRFYAARAEAAGDDARLLGRIGPYTHFLYRLFSGAAEFPPSVYFDPVWYKEHHEQARAAMAGQAANSAIQHYLSGGERLDPVPEFSEAFYLQANADVRAALDAGIYCSGYAHFLQTGVFEFRQPCAGIDLGFYRDANGQVRNDLNTGAVRDAFAHLRGIGLQAGLPYGPPPPDHSVSEAATKALFIAKARHNLAMLGRRRLDFTPQAACALSVIMVMYQKFELTMLALTSLRGNFAGDLQLILVDNGSTDATLQIGQYVTGAKIIRLEKNIGYLGACNLALEKTSAGLVLFLNNDVELGFGAVAAAIARIGIAPDIGAVGGKVIRTHGLLQEAGCILWQDGSTGGYMRDAPALAPEANFVRDVDFCSGVFLLCRAKAVKQLGGFDPDFSPAYYEDADLCVRLAACGLRTVYDPSIVITHLEYGSADGAAAQALMRRGRQIFVRKHAAFLQTRPINVVRNLAAARSPGGSGKNILFVEDTIPLRRLGSGYIRANDIVQAIAGAGHAVSVFPVNGADSEMPGVFSELPEIVEVLHDRDIGQLGEFLASRPGHYDLIWISRTHNLGRILPLCLSEGIDPARIPFVLDTEAIVTLRKAAQARLSGEDFDFAQHLQSELENARICRHCTAVNEAEAGLLRQAGLNAVSVLGTARQPDLTAEAFAAREGLLFVGSIHRPDSPNLDALSWYVEEILPALRQEMEPPPVLHFAGYVAPEIDLTGFAGHPGLKIHGVMADLRPLYGRCRLFIAPTRFAAGTPYKLYEAASFGLPIVATGLLGGQLNWQDGAELLAAPVGDAKLFAAQIARLYNRPQLWESLRENALKRIAQEHALEPFDREIRRILDVALAPCRDFAAPQILFNKSLFAIAGGQPFPLEKEVLPSAS